MSQTEEDGRPLQCPSAQPAMADAVAFGVVDGTVEEPRVAYLDQPVPVSADLLRLAGPVEPTEVMRFAAPCAEGACVHFDGSRCQLASRIAAMLPPAVDRLPRCAIRPRCRWWQQEGKAACLRCPQVVTRYQAPSEELRQAAQPARAP